MSDQTDNGVEVTAEATALLQREGKRLMIGVNLGDGLEFNLVCALCRGSGQTAYHGANPPLAEVRTCSLCGGVS